MSLKNFKPYTKTTRGTVLVDKSSLWKKVWNEKDTIKYTALAKTLKRIMLNGKKEIYEGKTASKLVKFVQKNGGIIT